jgi:hypothetical protein
MSFEGLFADVQNTTGQYSIVFSIAAATKQQINTSDSAHAQYLTQTTWQ